MQTRQAEEGFPLLSLKGHSLFCAAIGLRGACSVQCWVCLPLGSWRSASFPPGAGSTQVLERGMRGGVPCLLCRKRASWRCLSPQRTQSGVGKGNRGDPVGSFFAPEGLTARILLSSPTRRGFLFETWVSPCLHACVLGSQTGGVKAAGVHSRTAEGEGPEMRGIKDRSLSAVLQHGVAQFPVMQAQTASQREALCRSPLLLQGQSYGGK